MENQQQEDVQIHDQPTTTSWSDDWASAQEKADSYEEQFNASEQETEHSGSQGSDDDGAQDPEPSGEEGSVQRTEERGREHEAEDEDGSGDGEQREASQQRGLRRGLHSEEPAGSVDSEELTAFKEQAEKLGFSIDDRQVAKQERVSLRQERKEMRARMAEERDETNRRLQTQTAEFEQKYERAMRLQRAIDEDNLDGVAEAIGYKDWTEVNKAFLNKNLNPQHKEMMALRRQLKEREEREETAAKAAHQQKAQERHQAQQREYKRDLQDDISDLKDETLAAFSDHDLFVDTAFAYQQRHWDGVETISVQEAAELALQDAKKLYEGLHARFGGRSTQTSETPASGATAEKPAGATGKRRTAPKTVSQSQVADASAQADPNVLDEAAWTRRWMNEIASSTPDAG